MTPPPAGINLPLLRHLGIITFPMHEQQPEARKGEEYTIHDPKRKARLQHRTRPINAPREGTISIESIRPDREVEITVCGEVHAVCVGDGAELVHARDEGADEAEVDEGAEDGGFVARSSANERHYRPCQCEDGYYEEGEDVGRGELVFSVPAVDEPGLNGMWLVYGFGGAVSVWTETHQHAHGGYKSENLEDAPEIEEDGCEECHCNRVYEVMRLMR